MASLAAACRVSARRMRCLAVARGLATSSRCLAAHNFIMPALSPTMTEGNIASWKVKDGESYSAGDVLLEIETDKATMDVEAQEDGIMMKILSGDGSKSVQVGTRIAVTAEAGDDVAALEMPADERPPPKQQQQQQQPAAGSSDSETSSSQRPAESMTAAAEQKHPLMPAVEHLVRQHGLGEDDVRRIKPTGPNGRLLKGDVLAFLGTIKPDAPASVSDRFATLSRLDLSNIKVAAAAAKTPERQAKEAPLAPPPPPLEVNTPVSLAKVVEMQKRIREALGVSMPLSTFVSRAADIVNGQLSSVARSPPTPADLFDQILGLDKVKGSRRAYLPQIASMPLPTAPQPKRVAVDIIDELAGSARKPVAQLKPASRPMPSDEANVLKLVVAREEGQRARMFLERCKWFLEMDPGRLVLSDGGAL
ncbi:hypothetical protein XA68_11582 [Ophiocordyceps unilateralis]|uniref:Dihydrolipoamide acetyltransferase component of pyruvate dehydrogenase complex n=1 Tax=Ophiocordyceps unilateralis TaxID=268505 RepID=A0A2A9PF23_OPHUN|nr:hypothetical protein XA68_11582 [Ophiocordyceps unilateralis]